MAEPSLPATRPACANLIDSCAPSPDKRIRGTSFRPGVDRGTKRQATPADSPIAKKARQAAEPDFVQCLGAMVGDHNTLALPVVPAFEFGDIVAGFGEDGVLSVAAEPGLPILDSFLIDLPLSEEENSAQRAPCLPSPQQAPAPAAPSPVCTSPVSGANSSLPGSPARSGESSGGSFQEKRIADRAARNRESSRRAREKAKQRLRALESQNRALLDMIALFRAQNDDLSAQLHRAHTLQQGCSICCSYPGSFAPAASTPTAGLTPTAASPPLLLGAASAASPRGAGTALQGLHTQGQCRRVQAKPRLRLDQIFPTSV